MPYFLEVSQGAYEEKFAFPSSDDASDFLAFLTAFNLLCESSQRRWAYLAKNHEATICPNLVPNCTIRLDTETVLRMAEVVLRPKTITCPLEYQAVEEINLLAFGQRDGLIAFIFRRFKIKERETLAEIIQEITRRNWVNLHIFTSFNNIVHTLPASAQPN